jgi:hypothetical protein
LKDLQAVGSHARALECIVRLQIQENQMIEENKNSKICNSNSPKSGRWMAIGAGIGVALGAGIGSAFGNIPIGVGVGVAIGTAIGMLLNQKKN